MAHEARKSTATGLDRYLAQHPDRLPLLLHAYLEEYKDIREEVTQWTKFRDNLVLLTLAFSGAILSFGLTIQVSDSAGERIRVLAFSLVPAVAILLALFWWSNEARFLVMVPHRRAIRDKINGLLELSQDPDLLHTYGVRLHTLEGRLVALRTVRRVVDLVAGIVCFSGPAVASQLFLLFESQHATYFRLFVANWFLIAGILALLVTGFVLHSRVITLGVSTGHRESHP